MSTPGRYRTAALPATTDGYGQACISTNTCTDCGALVLDQNTHDTWHTIQAATHLHRDDILILDLTDALTVDRDALHDVLERLGIAHRTLIVGGGITTAVLPRETVEPGPNLHYAHCITCTADFAATTEQTLMNLTLDHCSRSGEAGGHLRHVWATGTRPPAREPGPTERPPGLHSDTTSPANPPCPDCGHDALLHTGPRSGCKAAHTAAGICGCRRTAW